MEKQNTPSPTSVKESGSQSSKASPPPQGPDPEYIKSLFSSISPGYDRANNFITFGMAHLWRKKLVKWSQAKAGDCVLDCATGTGDLALEFKKAVGSTGKVIGSDFCQDMLKVAPQKAKARNLDVQFEWGDATQLTYPDHSFDIVSIAYGIRNVSDPVLALKEMLRVCRPGGVLMVLETGDSQVPLIQSAFHFYFRNIVPRLGGLVTGHPEAYKYLNQSSQKFPSRKQFIDLVQQADPKVQVEFKTLMGGASFIYRCRRATQ